MSVPSSARQIAVLALNDTAIDGLPTLISLWPRLQGARQLQAVVLRNGQPVSLNINLR